MPFTPKVLVGQTTEHLTKWEGSPYFVHREVHGPLERLKVRALGAGFELQVASGFRDFTAQLNIWNQKATGKRPVLDVKGNPIDVSELTPEQTVHAIMRWSALPGASRHHWGTDIDVYDSNALPKGYKLQLIPGEYDKKGVFGPLSQWLDKHMGEESFFRPYATDRGGVSPERWHLSYRPLAERLQEGLTEELIQETLEQSDIVLKTTVIDLLPELYAQYIINTD